MDADFARALAAGLGIAGAGGLLGCFVVWRRMAYFGDSLAHSAILGIALGMLYGFNINFGMIAICTLFAALLMALQRQNILATDTLLGVLAHAALSVGVVIMSLADHVDGESDGDLHLHNFLFGDISRLEPLQTLLILGVAVIIALSIARNWETLTLMTIHEDIAKVEIGDTRNLHLMFTLLITLFVAISVQIVGTLLITSALIIPAAAASRLARSPTQMALFAVALGALAMCLGLIGAQQLDISAGPVVVLVMSILFAALFPLGAVANSRA